MITPEYLDNIRKNRNILAAALDSLTTTDERLDAIAHLILQQNILLEAGLTIQAPPLSSVGIPPYSVRKLDLTVARTISNPEELILPGDDLTFYTDGDFNGISFALDLPTNDWVPISEFGNPYRYTSGFQKIYLIWTAQPGKYLRIHCGREAGAEASVQITTLTSLKKASSATNGAVTVGAVSTAVLAANPDRTFATFVNDSAGVIYLCLGDPAALTSGIRLNATGGAFEINATNLYTGAVTAICAGGLVLTVTEG